MIVWLTLLVASTYMYVFVGRDIYQTLSRRFDSFLKISDTLQLAVITVCYVSFVVLLWKFAKACGWLTL